MQKSTQKQNKTFHRSSTAKENWYQKSKRLQIYYRINLFLPSVIHATQI